MNHSLPYTEENHWHDDSPSHVIDALRAVVDDVHTFLAVWLQRLEDVRPAAGDPYGDSVSPKLNSALNQCDRQSNDEAQQFEETTKQLTEAWLKLESEQRQFLQMKNQHPIIQRQHATTTQDRVRGEFNKPAPITSGASISGRARHRELLSTSFQPREAAVQQFERLQREIQSTRSS